MRDQFSQKTEKRLPLSPHKSGLQISVGHFSYVVSPKMDQILVNWSLFFVYGYYIES